MNAPDRYVTLISSSVYKMPPKFRAHNTYFAAHIFPQKQFICRASNMSNTLNVTPKKGGQLPVGLWSNASGYSCNKDPRINGNVGTKVDVTDDLPPERHELFLLSDGEKKVEYEPETRTFYPTHEINDPSRC